MADAAAGRAIPASFLLIVALLVAASAATGFCLSADAPAGGGSADQPAAGANRGVAFASRFLATAAAASRRKAIAGHRACRPGHPRACSVAGAAGGEHHHPGSRLKCCGGVCTDVRASASSCGACGRRCPFGRLCCGGRCAAVAHDPDNCGACGRRCAAGQPCTYGICGYA